MDNEGAGLGWKLGLAGSCLAAVLFAALWFLRGGEMDSLEARLKNERLEAGDASRRLESAAGAAKAEAEAAKRELSEAADKAARESRQLREQADQAENRLRSELADAAGRLENALRETERQRKLLAASQGAAGELADLREKLTKAEADNAGLREAAGRGQKAAAALADDLRDKLRLAERRLTELESRERGAPAAEKTAETPAPGAAEAAALAEAGEWRRKAGELEKRLSDLDERSRAEARRLSQALAEAEKSRPEPASPTPSGALRQELVNLGERLSAAQSEAAARADDLAAARERAAQAEFAAAKARQEAEAANREREAAVVQRRSAMDELAQVGKRLLTVQDELAKLEGRLSAAQAEAAAERGKAQAAAKAELDSLRRSRAEALAELDKLRAASRPGEGPAGRAVGKIVERLPDGRTLVITGGIDQRMSQGLKFDVYRQSGEGRRYLGGVKVIRVHKEYSLAVSTFSETRTLVCPATGLAVLEPGARFSPFATGRSGEPLPLRPASALALPREEPAVGDLLENPFYDPDRSLTFAISPKLLEDPCFTRVIGFFGGSPRTGPEAARADFLVVESDAGPAGAAAAGAPRRVTLAHLEKYMEPVLLPE